MPRHNDPRTRQQRRTPFARGALGGLGRVALGAGLAVVACGCGTDARVIRPLTAESFVAAPPTDSRSIGNPLDRPGAVNYDQVRLVGPPMQSPGANGNGNGGGPGGADSGISPTVRDVIRPPVALAPGEGAPAAPRASDLPGTGAEPRPPATGPAGTRPAGGGAEGGQFDYVGFVLMKVNDRPIYADRVLKEIEPALLAEAKNYGPSDFRKVAIYHLDLRVKLLEREELEFAMAERTLLPEDERMARALTVDWRQKQVTAAGGSLELAKRKAAADGWDFEDLTQQQYRVQMIRRYYQKHVFPKLFVPRSDMWAYYQANKDALFTTHGQVRFRVIKIDPAKYGGKDEAYTRAQEAIKAARETQDFAAVARLFNDDSRWQQSGGYVTPDGWVQQNALRLKELEDAAWKLRPGQVSDIVPIEGAFYIVKLEEVKQGKVQPFEDLAVQEQINQKLRSQQLEALREQHVQKLRENSATTVIPGMMNVALEMVMRRYPQWAAAR